MNIAPFNLATRTPLFNFIFNNTSKVFYHSIAKKASTLYYDSFCEKSSYILVVMVVLSYSKAMHRQIAKGAKKKTRWS